MSTTNWPRTGDSTSHPVPESTPAPMCNLPLGNVICLRPMVEAMNPELERHVRERTAQLEEAMTQLACERDKAESATRAKSEFLANMSHEVRTLMNAVVGMTHLALRTDMTAKQRGYLSKAKIAADSLLAIVNDILDFSKIEAGKIELEERPFLLQDVLDKVTSVVGLKADEKALELLLKLGTDMPECLVGDTLRLEQVLINLCSNAVKFTVRGAVVLSVDKAPAAGDKPGRTALRFSVRDTGIGMSQAQVQRLFQPFEQLDASTSRQYGGTGLGLAICKKLVELMGGTIQATSARDHGSEFSFTVLLGTGTTSARSASPAQMARQAIRPSVHAAAVSEAPRGLAGHRVLLVEDNEFNQSIATELLGEVAGMHVTLAENGREALRHLRAAPFDAVLMDVQMPVVDGYQATADIRAQSDFENLPVIAMTAHAMSGYRERCLAAGMSDYVTKPFEPAELFAVLLKWMPGGNPRLPTIEPNAAPAAVAGISFELGLNRCLGSNDLYERVLRRFKETRLDDAHAMRDAIAAHELARAASIAHSVISTAGAIGAQGLSEAARKLEEALKAGAGIGIPALLDTFARCHAQALDDLNKHVETMAPN